ncbi:MAG: T9SS type A sorting domain-containing protein [Paludibacter sp.]|nr:T9SS type A sorting domain-containing protein [Paludibacter sp.]
MKKITLCLCVTALTLLGLNAQVTLEVGSGKTYETLKAAWDAAMTETATDITISVAEGTYVESASLTALSGKSVTFIGAGADKTIVKRSASTSFALPGTTGWVTSNPNRLFQLNANSDNLNLTLEKMSFETIGYNNVNGGGVINANGTNQQFTFRSCNFKNIFARAGAIIQVQGADTLLKVTFDKCFIEECGSFNNNGFNALLVLQTGSLEVKNTTFMNNSFNALNIGTNGNGTDNNSQQGALINILNSSRSLVVENAYMVNNKFILGDTDKTHPMIGIKSKLGPDSVSVLIKNVISVGNKRTNSFDVDLYYQNVFAPVVENTVFNAARNFERTIVAEVETLIDTDVTEIQGSLIDNSLTYNSPVVNFEMDGDLPKVYTDENGVKYLNRLPTGINEIKSSGLLIMSNRGMLTITANQPENIRIYNLLGAKIANYNQTTQVDIALPAGTYIIRTNTVAEKVLVK